MHTRVSYLAPMWNQVASPPMAPKMPTLDHLGAVDYENVYEPSDDTYLFVDTLHFDREHIVKHVRPKIVLEIGYVFQA